MTLHYVADSWADSFRINNLILWQNLSHESKKNDKKNIRFHQKKLKSIKKYQYMSSEKQKKILENEKKIVLKRRFNQNVFDML